MMDVEVQRAVRRAEKQAGQAAKLAAREARRQANAARHCVKRPRASDGADGDSGDDSQQQTRAGDASALVLRVCVVGVGWYAKRAHLPALASIEAKGTGSGSAARIRVVAFVSRSAAAHAAAERRLGHAAARHDKLESALADPDIDVFDLVLPIPAMPAAIAACLRAGKHVVSEKPGAPSLAEGLELFRVWRGASAETGAPGVAWVVCEQWGHKPGALQLQRLLDHGAVGSVRGFHFRFVQGVPAGTGGAADDWRTDGSYSGGWHRDVGVHFVRVLRNLFGSIVTVTKLGTVVDGAALPGSSSLASSSSSSSSSSNNNSNNSNNSSSSFDSGGSGVDCCASGVSSAGIVSVSLVFDSGVRGTYHLAFVPEGGTSGAAMAPPAEEEEGPQLVVWGDGGQVEWNFKKSTVCVCRGAEPLATLVPNERSRAAACDVTSAVEATAAEVNVKSVKGDAFIEGGVRPALAACLAVVAAATSASRSGGSLPGGGSGGGSSSGGGSGGDVSAEAALRDLAVVEAMLEAASAPNHARVAVAVPVPTFVAPGGWICDASATRRWRPSLVARCDSAAAVQAAVRWATYANAAARGTLGMGDRMSPGMGADEGAGGAADGTGSSTESAFRRAWTVRASGSRHSWSPYAGCGDHVIDGRRRGSMYSGAPADDDGDDAGDERATPGLLHLDLVGLRGPIAVDRDRALVTCGAGVLLGDVVRAAAAHSLGLASVPILHEQTVQAASLLCSNYACFHPLLMRFILFSLTHTDHPRLSCDA